jgi:WD40 repeat protein
LFHPEGGIDRLAFSPDGRSVLICDTSGVTRLWDVATGRTLGPAACSDGRPPVAFSPDGKLMAVGDEEGRLALWETPAPAEGTPERVRLTAELLTGLELAPGPSTRELGPEELQERRRRLETLGGPTAALSGRLPE